MSITTDRIDALEQRLDGWEDRLDRVELQQVAGVTTPRRTPATGCVSRPTDRPAPAAQAPVTGSHAASTAQRPGGRDPQVSAPPRVSSSASPTPPGPTISVEQLLGGRVLAWVGGAAVLAGLAFLFALGVSSGWLDETGRCLIGALAAVGLVAGGAILHERRGRTTAALAAVGAGIAGLFLAVGFSTVAYGLMPALAGAVLAAGVGALGTSLALRWDSSAIGGLGLIGAVLSPAVSGALGQPSGLVLLWIAAAAAVAVVVHRRWGWLGVALAVAASPQWLTVIADGQVVGRPGSILVVLVAFGILGVVAAIGHELRVPAAGLRPSSTFLLAGTALTLGLAGYVAIDDAGSVTVATGWLAALAGAHLVGGAVARRSDRITDELAVLLLVLGTVLADVAFALALDGTPRALGWAVSTVGFALLVRRAQGDLDPEAAYTGLGVHVVLAAVGVFGQIEPTLSGDGSLDVAGAMALAMFAAGALTSARLAAGAREALDVLALLALAGLVVLTLDGPSVTVTWAAAAAGLAAIARRTDDKLTASAAAAHLAAALAWSLGGPGSVEGLGTATADLGAAAVGLGAVALAAGRMAWSARHSTAFTEAAEPLAAVAGTVVLYLASLTAVAVHPGSTEAMQGQLQLTALWAATGVIALVAGLCADIGRLRAAALGLLALAGGKLFVVDLATLDAAWRVVACIGVGLLLLLGAFAHARLRPEALPDLREKETAFR